MRRFELLQLGIASHHAGMLPLEKALAEQLFQANLLKVSLAVSRLVSRLCLGCTSAVPRLYLAHLLEVVFATETLAAGINMPARTTVVTTLSKRGDRGVEPLAASALLQLAGRSSSRRASPVLADE